MYMRLVLTHSARHYAPKRHPRYTPMPATPPGVSFLCFERTRMVKTLRFAPARSLNSFVTVCQGFASLHPSTSSAIPLPYRHTATERNTRRLSVSYHLLCSVFFATMPLAMSDYHLKPFTTLPSIAAQEAKEQRRKQLEAVRERRKIIYQRFRQRMQEQRASQHLA